MVAAPATAVAVVEAATSAAPAAAAAAGTATDARGATGPRGRDLVNDLARWRATPTPSAETRGAPGARARTANDDGAAHEPGRREAPRWRAGERFVRAREGAVAVAPKKTRESDVDILAFPPRARRGREGLEGSARPRRTREGPKRRARVGTRGGRARVVSRGSDRPRSRQRTPCTKDRVVLTRKRGRPGILAIPSTNGLRMDSDADRVKPGEKVHFTV